MRGDMGRLDCDVTEGRGGTLMRESVVQNATLFVAASIREVAGRGSENLTLLGLASAVKREWIEETFPDQITNQIEHLYDRTHKRVAAVKLVRFHDLVIHHAHQREVDAKESGRCLAEAFEKGYFELPLFKHEIRQFIGPVNLIAAVMPEFELPPFDQTQKRLAEKISWRAVVVGFQDSLARCRVALAEIGRRTIVNSELPNSYEPAI